jgi:hypothetical protein
MSAHFVFFYDGEVLPRIGDIVPDRPIGWMNWLRGEETRNKRSRSATSQITAHLVSHVEFRHAHLAIS